MKLSPARYTLLSRNFGNHTYKVSSHEFHSSQQRKCVGEPMKDQKPVPVFIANNVTSSFREDAMKKVYHYMTVYEEFIGIKQVKEAHARVLQAEERFVKSQEQRRTAHSELVVMQNRLRELRGELDRTARGNEKYLELVTKEINLMREERHFRQNFEDHEKREREAFNELSNALRFSHEKERAQNEKTKYWSLIGSLVGASVGIIGTSINSQIKIRQLKKVMTESSTESLVAVQEKLSALVSQIDQATHSFPSANSENANVESALLEALGKFSDRIEDLNQRLERVEFDGVIVNSYGNAGDNSKLSDNNNTQLQDSNFRKTVSIATATIIICVPLINKILSTYF